MTTDVICLSDNQYLNAGVQSLARELDRLATQHTLFICATGHVPVREIGNVIAREKTKSHAVVVVFSELYSSYFFCGDRRVRVISPDAGLAEVREVVLGNQDSAPPELPPPDLSKAEKKTLLAHLSRTQNPTVSRTEMSTSAMSHHTRKIMDKCRFRTRIHLYRFIVCNELDIRRCIF